MNTPAEDSPQICMKGTTARVSFEFVPPRNPQQGCSSGRPCVRLPTDGTRFASVTIRAPPLSAAGTRNKKKKKKKKSSAHAPRIAPRTAATI